MANRSSLCGLFKEVASTRTLEALVVARPLFTNAAWLYPDADLNAALEVVATIVEFNKVEVEQKGCVLSWLRDDRKVIKNVLSFQASHLKWLRVCF